MKLDRHCTEYRSEAAVVCKKVEPFSGDLRAVDGVMPVYAVAKSSLDKFVFFQVQKVRNDLRFRFLVVPARRKKRATVVALRVVAGKLREQVPLQFAVKFQWGFLLEKVVVEG